MASIDLSLDRIRTLISLLSRYTRPTIHIAGTNGKGSVASIVSSILHQSGLKVGRFTSPHLVTVRDSITIGQVAVTQERYQRTRSIVDRLNRQGDSSTPPPNTTIFEALTATALQIFEEEKVDVAVVEVGMGGRLDATNVIPDEVVKVSAITAVDIDHVRWLGSSVSSIAREKAGIARHGVPLVLGPQPRVEVQQVVAECARNVGTTLVAPAKVSTMPPTTSALPPPPQTVLYHPRNGEAAIKLEFPLFGSHQIDNLSTALSIIECLQEQNAFARSITSNSIIQGVKLVRWAGRLEFLEFASSSGKRLLLLVDGAHNSASMQSLRRYIDDNHLNAHSPVFIVALSESPPKTPTETLGPLLRAGDRVYVTRFSPVEDMPWVRPTSPDEVAESAKTLVGPTGMVWTSEGESSIGNLETLTEILERVATESSFAIVVGSLYLVADIYRLKDSLVFGVEP
ncbi:related to FOL3-Dihydrofolate synthetase [Serendipita indica DSM 11827]|uniref:Dihydrofolate synthetase n=1 Tax=Serendipita indica (strain DSM 11827) TaxID=1109443 RepID=G4TIY0_SERID|nr:related to FOL3-Dihydrofolate synthetase [Serendipita indica DSM 11827]